jgi:signal transduction histidine kinase
LIPPLFFITFILIVSLTNKAMTMVFNRFPTICRLVFCGALLSGLNGKSQISEEMFPMFIQQASIPDIQDIYGSGFRDLNGDGKIDLYLVGFRSVNRLLINMGPGFPFQDATIESGLGGNLMPMETQNLELGTLLFDFDNDGDSDVLIAGWGETIHLYRNDGQLRFQSVPEQLQLVPPVDANAAVASDVNNDGWLDLFITDEHFPNYLLIHDGRNRYRESSNEWGIVETAVSQGAAFCDVDLDGDPDLYVCNWFAPDVFYENMAFKKFRQVRLPLPSLTGSYQTNAPAFGDLDNDGDFDLIITNRDGPNFVYRNDTARGDSLWQFTDISDSSGLNDPGMSYGCAIADFDHDGWPDVFVANIGPNRYYRNEHSVFRLNYSESEVQFPGQTAYSTSATVGDVDDDGDADLFVANKDTFSLLFLNPRNDSAFVEVRVQGVESNRDAIGARITIYRAGHGDDPFHLLGTREIRSVNGYLSVPDSRALFGLDTVRAVDIRIRFPSGRIVTKDHVRAGQIITVFEKDRLVRFWFHFRRHLFRLTLRPRFRIELILGLIFFTLVGFMMWTGRRRYQWHGSVTGLAGTGFFGLALMVLILLEPYELSLKLSIIDGLVLLFMGLLLIYGERVHQLHMNRERYRHVLIDLGNQVSTIHDDEALIRRVIDQLVQLTEFNCSCILLYHTGTRRFTSSYCRGISDPIQSIDQSVDHEIRELVKQDILVKKEVPASALMRFAGAELIVAIKRSQFFGVLTLGTSRKFRHLPAEDRAVFRTLANQLAVALENNAYVRQSNEMIQKLTESKVKEAYLKELESANQQLDQKNQALQKLYDELKQTESQLIQSEKMASLGQLIAGISHELNNPVGFIYANLKQLKTSLAAVQNKMKQKTPSGLFQDIETLINDALTGSRMVKTLVEHLRRFSHLDQAERKRANIHEGIETCLMILKPRLSGIRIRREFKSSGEIECNIGQLNQVFLNIIANAAQAIQGKGEIRIRTEDRNNRVMISIQDTGGGIAPEILPRIFDPFYTTKDVGEGTGLGLSISYAIVKQHQGEIRVNSKPGEGTTVKIDLPI